MKFIRGEIDGIWILEPEVFTDCRGFFMETWSRREFEAHGLFCEFVQDNHSGSLKKGTLRGIHFQRGEKAQAKLLRCVRGAVLDVAVDLRGKSPSYRKWEAVELSAENRREILIPRGFGHGFLTLEDRTEVLYRADSPYAPEADGGILWNDPELGIPWGIADPVLSGRDAANPLLRDAVTGFEGWKFETDQ